MPKKLLLTNVDLVEEFRKNFRPKDSKIIPKELNDLRDYLVCGNKVEKWLKKIIYK